MKQSFVKPMYRNLSYLINSVACVDRALGISKSSFHSLEITDYQPITKKVAFNTENSETYHQNL